jgi:hypothetical protein
LCGASREKRAPDPKRLLFMQSEVFHDHRGACGGADSAGRVETGGRGGRRWEATTAARGAPTVYERVSSVISCECSSVVKDNGQ